MPKSPTIPWFKAYKLMATAKSMAELYEREKDTTSKYVHATSRGHEPTEGQSAGNRQLVDTGPRDLAVDVDHADLGGVDEDPVARTDHDVQVAVAARERLVVDLAAPGGGRRGPRARR